MSERNHQNQKPLLFISHKHADSKIADVIRLFVTTYSGGRIEVFQSSSSWADAPKVGRNLNKQLRESLWKASVVILVYTSPEQDWNYCMWECGVASHPHNPDTKIILFQCTGSSPALFADQVNVNVRNLVDVQKFTDEFLTAQDFFPELGEAITRFQPHGQEVASIAADFSQKLQPVLPPEKEDPSEDWPAFPFLQFELSFQNIEIILKAELKDRTKVADDIIKKGCIINSADKYGEQLFGKPSFPPNMTLTELANSWREKYPASPSKWVEALCNQIMYGAMWEFPKPVLEFMQGVSDNNWHAPVLIRVRKIPIRQCMQFDVYFYKINADPQKGSVEINLPISPKD